MSAPVTLLRCPFCQRLYDPKPDMRCAFDEDAQQYNVTFTEQHCACFKREPEEQAR